MSDENYGLVPMAWHYATSGSNSFLSYSGPEDGFLKGGLPLVSLPAAVKVIVDLENLVVMESKRKQQLEDQVKGLENLVVVENQKRQQLEEQVDPAYAYQLEGFFSGDALNTIKLNRLEIARLKSINASLMDEARAQKEEIANLKTLKCELYEILSEQVAALKMARMHFVKI